MTRRILGLLLALAPLVACGGSIAYVGPDPDASPPDPSPNPTPRPNPTPLPYPVPTPLPRPTPIEAGPDAPNLTLGSLRKAFAGAWDGTATAPAGWQPASWGVAVTFGGDETGNRYSAKCADGSPSGCLAFYYGNDHDTPTHIYSIDDLTASGDGIGKIYLWDEGGASTADIKRLRLSEGGSRLTFDLWNGASGPIAYDLVRSP